MSNTFSFPQQLYRFNLGAKNGWNLFVAWFSAVAVQIQLGGQKTVGTCLLHVKYFQFSTAAVRSQLAGKKKRLEPVRCTSSFISVSAVLQVSLLCWVSLALGCLGCCCCWSFSVPVLHGRKVSIYISLSLCPLPLPHPSLPPPSAPPSPYVYIICWSSLRNRNAHGSLCFGSTMWEYTGASSNSSADHFSMIISVCRNYHQGAKIQVRVPVTGRPFFNDKVGMPYLRRGCRIYVEGVVTRSTVSDAGVGGSGECDPILRQLVSEQFSFRTDGKWTQSSKDTFTLYADDVRQLLRDQCRIFKEAFALAGPQCRWFVIAGSPCQDLTPAGPLKGLLGLTGPCSSLFYYVHVILWLLQMNYPLELIRFLLENAGTMLEIHRKAILRALGLNADLHPDHFRVDPKNTHGIKRNRFYFRNYQDCAKVPKTVVLPANDLEGPLLDFSGFPIPFGPLLRVRAVLGHDVYQLSWTAYQPISLIWDYLFWGDKKQFQTKAKMQCSDTIPALDFEKSLPPHYLRAWNRFMKSLRQANVSTIDRDWLVRAILPIFHHPYIKAPMRILSCEEVEKLAGLHNHFDRVHAHRSLLTELTVRNYCGNSFHPEHIQAAIGHPERLRNWLIEPAEPSTQPPWSGVIHPKQARTQYHALREQVQTLARTQRVRDLSSKQVGLDPMPEFPIHALEGNLAPVMPTVLPVQLLPAARKIHPDDLGIRENKPPSQLSLTAIQLLQKKKCKTSSLE